MILMLETKSDNLIYVRKTMTATEVARNFSDALDFVEAGDEIEITRGKKVIAILQPSSEPKTVGNLLKLFEERHQKRGPMDDRTYEFHKEVLDERYAPQNLVGGDQEPDPWER